MSWAKESGEHCVVNLPRDEQVIMAPKAKLVSNVRKQYLCYSTCPTKNARKGGNGDSLNIQMRQAAFIHRDVCWLF